MLNVRLGFTLPYPIPARQGGYCKGPRPDPLQATRVHETALLSKVHVTQSQGRYANTRLACQTLVANGQIVLLLAVPSHC